jgi:2,3-diketo-5-methylthio-1-phosphopentane phosphatase
MISGVRKKRPPIVFLDFDNTITSLDVLDAVIGRFSIDEKWMACEEAWKEGKIGSRDCLEAQLKSVRVSRKELAHYVREIPLDPFFLKLLWILDHQRIPFMIVSDSFTFIIETILRHHGVQKVKIFANELRFQKDRLIPLFPYHSKDCRRCAHCKKIHVLAHKDHTTIYVGDGLSDVCPALVSDFVFAKDTLASHLEAEGKTHTAFRDLGDICAFFERAKQKQFLTKVPTHA